VEISNLPLPIPSRLFKKELEKSKYHSKKVQKSTNNANNENRYTYAQASSLSVKKVPKIKENFLNLSLKKIENIHKIINKLSKTKPHINMITKGLSQR